MKHPDNKLSDPISLSSPTQLAILFYDILGLESPDKKAPRGTGEDILKHFAQGKEKNLCEAILGMRNVEKLIGTYIDKMPEIALEDGRVHASYNQYGAKTGRFSSNEPNLQNIPSKNHEIRQMFKAAEVDEIIESDSDYFEVNLYNKVETKNGYIEAKELKVGDILIVEENNKNIEIIVNKIDRVVDKNHILLYY